MTNHRANELNERAELILRRHVGRFGQASEDARDAARYCMELYAEVQRQRHKVRQLVTDRSKLRQRARSGFLASAKKLPAEAIPPVLREFAGQLVECPVPCAGNRVIYFLLRGDDVVYVGQTVSIETRVTQHIGYGKTFDRVLVMHVPEPKIDAVEKELIRRLLPRLNATHVPTAVRRARCIALAGAEGGL